MCTNCESTGRICDGYNIKSQFRAVTFQPIGEASSSSAVTFEPDNCRLKTQRSRLELGMIVQQPEFCTGSPQEQSFFTLFRENHAPMLGGYFDSNFWSFRLPRIAQSEPAVYHAIIAISTLDQGRLHSDNKALSLYHYNKAIHFVKHHLQSVGISKHVILLTCLLFICLEFRKGNTEDAFNHLQSGLRILQYQELGNGNSELSDTNHCLVHAFSRLSIQSSLAGRQSPHGCHLALKGFQPAQDLFSNIEEARNSLVNLFVKSLSLEFNVGASIPHSYQSRRATLVSQLHYWNSQIDLFMVDRSSSSTRQDQNRVCLLRIQSLVALIWNSNSIPPLDGSSIELVFDSYTRDFERIMSLASFLMGSTSSTTSSDPANPSTAIDVNTRVTAASTTFSLDTALIFALYFVAIKCRSPTIRRQAAKFLSLVEPQREGMLDARVLHVVSRYVIEFEERSCLIPVTEERWTWPRETSRLHAIDMSRKCDYERRTQSFTFVWMPDGNEGGYNQWSEDITF